MNESLTYEPIGKGKTDQPEIIKESYEDFIERCNKLIEGSNTTSNKNAALTKLCNEVIKFNDIGIGAMFIDHMVKQHKFSRPVVNTMVKRFEQQKKQEDKGREYTEPNIIFI